MRHMLLFKGWFFILALLFSETQACSRTERAGLLRFKSFFSFPNAQMSLCRDPYLKTESWKEETDCCRWDGVTCNDSGAHVIGLNLSCSLLVGSLPSTGTGFLLLPYLQMLDLSRNSFTGSQIPSDLTRMVGLKQLNLAYAGLSGEIGLDISLLSNLELLDFTSTDFALTVSGQAFGAMLQNMSKLQQLRLGGVDMTRVPLALLSNLSASLSWLTLRDCGLRGNLPQQTFHHLANLESLDLGGNLDMSGHFPQLNWSSPLRDLYLYFTHLGGELPEAISNLTSLQSLILSSSFFFGPFPASLGNLTQLTSVDLSSNDFHGEIPSSFQNLRRLNYLSLSGDSSASNIPMWLGNLTLLTHLTLFRGFVGQIPASLSNLKQLSSLEMDGNKLVGSIPSSFGDFPKLTDLLLPNNSLSGRTPSAIFSLPQLRDLDLSSNRLYGPIDEFRAKSLEKIDLSNNKLNGQIPSSIFRLINLTYVYLGSNNLSGPVELSSVTELKNLHTLDLSQNPLSSLSTKAFPNSSSLGLSTLTLASCNLGEFPDILRYLPNVTYLDLSDNRIAGEIPSWMSEVGQDSLVFLNLSHNFITRLEQVPWKKLQYLDLQSNMIGRPLPLPPPFWNTSQNSGSKLTGDRLPSSICNLSSLQVLNLSNNSFTGTIPECLLYSSPVLSVVDLQKNRLRGTIPDRFVNGCSLLTINLHDNKLEGPLPRSLSNCTVLEVLDVGKNNVKDTFPSWLGHLPNLQVLVLHSNQFHGPVDVSESSHVFSELRILDLSFNNFTGAISGTLFEDLKGMMTGSEEKGYMGTSYYQDSVTITSKGMEVESARILTIFTTIDLSINNFQGQIPGSIGDLQALIVLNISHNHLSGSIPSSLANLKGLESLDLSSNSLAGEIPPQMVSLTFLSWLNLSYNKFVGSIPAGNQFNTFQNDSYLGNLGLCGAPLSKKCNSSMAGEPPQQEEDSFTEGFCWQVVLMGFGCGSVVGILTGSLMLRTRKPLWLARMVERECHRIQVIRNRKSRGRRARMAKK